MRVTRSAWMLVLAAGLTACGAETSAPPGETGAATPEATMPAATTAQPTTPAPTTDGPAGEVPAGTRAPTATETATEPAGAPTLPAGVDAAWAPYYAKIPFVFGSEKGFAAAKAQGRPMMLFYAATW